jgi:hypothetical protein
MRHLFIPEIGTELTLALNWSFSLHTERRNNKMLDKLGYTSFPSFYSRPGDELVEDDCTLFLNAEQDKEFDDLYESCYTGRKVKTRYGDEFEKEHDGDLYRKKRHEFYLKYVNSVPNNFITHTFNSGTILKLDRIYIRKGNSDYSSVTFYVKNGELKGQRFWAKLEEVNQMIIE